MKASLLTVLAVAAVIATACGPEEHGHLEKDLHWTVQVQPQEDDPGWNCRTQGNELCFKDR